MRRTSPRMALVRYEGNETFQCCSTYAYSGVKKKQNNFEEIAADFHTPDYVAALHAQYPKIQEQLMPFRTASKHLDRTRYRQAMPLLHQFVPISPHAIFTSIFLHIPPFCTPSSYNPNFCFFTLGNTPMSTIPAVTMTAHSCIFSVPLLKSVCVAAATVVRLSTSSTYPLIRWYFHSAFALSTPP